MAKKFVRDKGQHIREVVLLTRHEHAKLKKLAKKYGGKCAVLRKGLATVR